MITHFGSPFDGWVDYRKDKHTLEPGFCIAHELNAPCLQCLIPVVMRKIAIKNIKEPGMIFQQADRNEN